MLSALADTLELLAAMATKSTTGAPPRVPAAGDSSWGTIDHFRKIKEPKPADLLAQLKGIAYACATLNASVCAQHRPRLYVVTNKGAAAPKCPTRPLDHAARKALESDRQAMATESNLQRWDEVIEHPLLALLNNPNPYHNAHELLETTTLQQETTGAAYWLIERDPFGLPTALLPLRSHLITHGRRQGSPRPFDYYEYWIERPPVKLAESDVIDFRYPDPRDPYCGALAPLRGCYEEALQTSKYNATRHAVLDNSAIPGVIISPGEVISETEMRRIENQWHARFGRGKQGSVLVAESNLEVQVISQQLGDIAALAEARLTKEMIANAFGVPMAFWVSDSNRANLEAAREQHVGLAIKPRLDRRDARLNQRLVPLYDETGRLFLKTNDPDPRSREIALKEEDQDMHRGVRTINDVRAIRGLPPVEWGAVPWMPLDWAPSDFARRTDYARSSGRNSDPDRHNDAAKTEGDKKPEPEKSLATVAHTLAAALAKPAPPPVAPAAPAAPAIVNISLARTTTTTETKVERDENDLITRYTRKTIDE